MDFTSSTRAAEDRHRELSVMPRRPRMVTGETRLD